jgi:hypothetical protein
VCSGRGRFPERAQHAGEIYVDRRLQIGAGVLLGERQRLRVDLTRSLGPLQAVELREVGIKEGAVAVGHVSPPLEQRLGHERPGLADRERADFAGACDLGRGDLAGESVLRAGQGDLKGLPTDLERLVVPPQVMFGSCHFLEGLGDQGPMLHRAGLGEGALGSLPAARGVPGDRARAGATELGAYLLDPLQQLGGRRRLVHQCHDIGALGQRRQAGRRCHGLADRLFAALPEHLRHGAEVGAAALEAADAAIEDRVGLFAALVRLAGLGRHRRPGDSVVVEGPGDPLGGMGSEGQPAVDNRRLQGVPASLIPDRSDARLGPGAALGLWKADGEHAQRRAGDQHTGEAEGPPAAGLVASSASRLSMFGQRSPGSRESPRSSARRMRCGTSERAGGDRELAAHDLAADLLERAAAERDGPRRTPRRGRRRSCIDRCGRRWQKQDCSGDMYAGVPRIVFAAVSATSRWSPSRGPPVRRLSSRPGSWLCASPEVDHAHAAIRADQDIVGFEVAVDQSGAVRRRQALSGLEKHRERLSPVPRPGAEPGAAVLAGDVLHGDESLSVGLADLVDLHDVGVRQAGQRLGLALHASGRLGPRAAGPTGAS